MILPITLIGTIAGLIYYKRKHKQKNTINTFQIDEESVKAKENLQ